MADTKEALPGRQGSGQTVDLYEAMSRLNNELADMHRELAQKNAALEVANAQIAELLQISAQEHITALRESEKKYHTVADFTYDWELWISPEGKLLYISPSCERITGYRAEEFIVEPALFIDVIHPDDRDAVSSHVKEELMHTTDAANLDYRIITRGGEVRWINHSCIPVHGEDRSYWGRRASNRDITERKQAEAALTISEMQYRRLFESAQDGILILDAETGKIMDVNPCLMEMLGYSKEQCLEKTIREIGFFKDIASHKDKFLELQQKEYGRYENLSLETAGGLQKEVEFISNVYLVNSQKVIQCNIRDITDRKRLEEALVQARKYETMSTFSAGYITLTKDDIKKPDSALKFLDEAEKIVFKARDITGEFLT
ncbi:MAG: PAS domain S-box protein, partial [Pseudomonadota bacterium]